MRCPLPNLGATITWATRCRSQDRRNEASRPDAGNAGGERKWPCSPLLQMDVHVAPACLMIWPTARIYIRGASPGHAGLDRTVHPPSRGLTSVPCTRAHAAIINSLCETKPRRVAPSALVDMYLQGRSNRYWSIIPDIARVCQDIDPTECRTWCPPRTGSIAEPLV